MSTFECMCCHCTLNVVQLITEEIHPFLLLPFFRLWMPLSFSVSLSRLFLRRSVHASECMCDAIMFVQFYVKKTCTSEWNSVRTWNLKCGQHQKFNISRRFSLCLFVYAVQFGQCEKMTARKKMPKKRTEIPINSK